MEYRMRPIGVIHSPFIKQELTPIQSSRSDAFGKVEIYAEFVDGLRGVEDFSHLILLYVFHCSDGYSLTVKPFLDDQLHGLFVTRYPHRPNPIGLSVVQLVGRQGNILEVQGIDMLDGTPLLDIKPYMPDFDVRHDVRTGWYAHRSKE